MEAWMNQVYKEMQSPTMETFVKWLMTYLQTFSPPVYLGAFGFIVLVVVLYSTLLKNAMKGIFVLLIVFTLSFLAFYILVFQPNYPREQVVKALNSENALHYLEDRERHKLEIRGLVVTDPDYGTLKREDVAIIGNVDTEKLKSIVFSVQDEAGKSTYFKGYGYVEKAPEGTDRNYVEYYAMDEEKILPQILLEDFFNTKYYNVVVYQK